MLFLCSQNSLCLQFSKTIEAPTKLNNPTLNEFISLLFGLQKRLVIIMPMMHELQKCAMGTIFIIET